MKVSISVTVEVDEKGWALDYGKGSSPKAIREDVKNYLTSVVYECNQNIKPVSE